MESSVGKTVEKVIIVGAGTSGLALAHNLKRRNILPRIFDKGEVVAETWRRRYKQLRLNTYRRHSELPGLSLPRSVGVFASRDAFVSYLENYESLLSLPINFGVGVNRIDRANGYWRLSTTDGEFLTEHVVVATGREHIPVYPKLPGSEKFSGQFIHAADFGDVENYAGKKVLVIGGGNSGVDILNHLVRIPASELWVSLRSGMAISPKWVLGIPLTRFVVIASRVPVPLLDRMIRLTERLVYGDLTRFGWKQSREGALSRIFRDGTAFPIDDGFVDALKVGKVTVVPQVRSISAQEVILDDDRQIRPDVIICATGYSPGLEDLVGHLDVLDAKGIPTFQGNEASAAVPGLWFLGMKPSIYGNIHGTGIISADLAEKIGATFK